MPAADSLSVESSTAHSPQRMEFRTELKQLLDLIVHSLYTKQEIFLRELVSNSADAIDKARFERLKDPQDFGDDTDWRIRLVADEKAGTLIVSDNGIGMSRESIVENLGTIAKSGTRTFLESLQQADAKDRPELIGQFGVGFYSSFMVADRVTVISRPAGASAEGVKWESDGQGQFTVEPYDKPTRGTNVVLHLREDAKEFLSPWRLREIVKRYSDYIEHPIVAVTEKPDSEKKEPVEKSEEVLNSRQAIWLRPKGELKEDDYKAFYRQISHDVDGEPLKTIHVVAEGGATDFRALLYIPSTRGWDWMMGPEKKSSIDLYVRRVLIMHECEHVAPAYLRFVKGVVDSSDLPLNVSRETIQNNPVLARIKSNLVNRVLKTLEDMKANEYETYLKFYAEFGPYLKEGAAHDWNSRERLADLLLFESTKTDPKDEKSRYTTLARYVEGMAEGQADIYYLAGEGRELIENSPYLEAFKARGQEVLLLTEPIDEFLASSLREYKGKSLKPVDRGAAPDSDKVDPAAEKEMNPLLEALKSKLGDEVKDVRLSARLKDSAAVLVADEGAMGAHMERLMQRLGRGAEMQPAKRVLELNAAHPAVQALRKLHGQTPEDPRVEAYGRLLYDQAVIAEGSRIKDPAAFARRLNDLLTRIADGAPSA